VPSTQLNNSTEKNKRAQARGWGTGGGGTETRREREARDTWARWMVAYGAHSALAAFCYTPPCPGWSFQGSSSTSLEVWLLVTLAPVALPLGPRCVQDSGLWSDRLLCQSLIKKAKLPDRHLSCDWTQSLGSGHVSSSPAPTLCPEVDWAPIMSSWPTLNFTEENDS
jgi:hypothetical protein